MPNSKKIQRPQWKACRPWLRCDTENLPRPDVLDVQSRFIRKKLLKWKKDYGRFFPWRSEEASPYQQIITEVLLQQTSATAVAGQYEIFFNKFPSWKALASASEDEIGAILKPLGLWRKRAANLKRLGCAMKKNRGVYPSSRNDIEQLPGVGQYVASAVLIFAHGKAEPLLDVNMARIIERYFGFKTKADLRHDPFIQVAARKIVSGSNTQEVNWAILDFGALVCKATKPACSHCPLRTECHFGALQLKE